MTATIDPALRSFIPVSPESHFPLQNLPFGVFRGANDPTPHIGTAIGDWILDLTVLESRNALDVPSLRGKNVFREPALNAFMALGRPAWQETRAALANLLSESEARLRDDAGLREHALVEAKHVKMLLPANIGDYTDFYSSKEHAKNVGTMFRGPAHALNPNWVHLPIAYHGRASTVVVSGTDLHRPKGQTKSFDTPGPTFGPSTRLDFELEVGFFVGPGNELGRPIPLAQTSDHIFGMVLVNDWSARDIQKWEYVPLGPFLGKNFGTSISPWVVTLDALEPFRTKGPGQNPTPLPYLRMPGDWAYDISLEVHMHTEKGSTSRLGATNHKFLYWSINQQLAHHTVNGCQVRPGDLMASGTISGPTPDAFGSLLELTWKGAKSYQVGDEKRSFLQDGDRVTMTGWCQGKGYRVGFGEVTGKILPAVDQ